MTNHKGIATETPVSGTEDPIPGGGALDNDAFQEILRLVHAMMDGRLGERGRVEQFSGPAAELIRLVNQMVDALVTPLQVTARSIDQIAHGSLPDFIIDEYQGEFNDIKRNLNTFLAIMYGMHHETRNLTQSIQAGKLGTRGNDWDFEGNWQQLIGGVNNTLDAVLTPIQEASAVLGIMSNYDLRARVSGTYKGEHAHIKKALNKTAESLQSALEQVAEAVVSVTMVCGEITKSSEEVAQGASAQVDSIQETSRQMEHIAAMAKQNQENTAQATVVARTAKESVEKSKESAAQLAAAMGDIRASAEGTSVIIQEINTVALQIDSLVAEAAVKASKVGAAGRGFSVLATEMRELAKRSLEAVAQMESIAKSATKDDTGAGVNMALSGEGVLRAIQDINLVARQTNYLALNAAVQAAHIEETGRGFETFTDEVRRLSVRTKEAALNTGGLISRSVELAQNGEAFSQNIDQTLKEVVDGVAEVSSIVEQISAASRDQTVAVEAVNGSIAQVGSVTQQATANAKKSFAATRNLEEQAAALNAMVDRFHLGPASPASDDPPTTRQAITGPH